jgi:hypothetical protein
MTLFKKGCLSEKSTIKINHPLFKMYHGSKIDMILCEGCISM